MPKKILKILAIIIVVLAALSLVIQITKTETEKGTNYSSYDAAPEASYTRSGSYEIESPLGLLAGKSSNTGATDQTAEQANSAQTSRLVIKTGIINMVVNNVSASAKQIITYAGKENGWVVSSSVSEQKELPSGSVTIRVPAEKFDQAMVYLRELAEKVNYEGSQGQDITEEFTDLQSSLKNLEAAETQLQKIMERAGTITEVLSVQNELINTRQQIELTKGRMKYLEQNAKMATITVNLALSEDLLPIPPSEKWRPVYIIKRAWKSVLSFLKSLSYLVIWIGVFAIVWVPITIIILLARKFWRKHKTAGQK